MKNVLMVATAVASGIGAGILFSKLSKKDKDPDSQHVKAPIYYEESSAQEFDEGSESKPFLGCSIHAFEDRNGMVIQRVAHGSPAALADLRPKDIILQINGKEINSITEYYTAVGTKRKVLLRVLIEREGGRKEVEVLCL